MADSGKQAQISEAIANTESIKKNIGTKNLFDYFSLAIATCAVGYIPFAPGTWGSIVGVLIYLLTRFFEIRIVHQFSHNLSLNENTTAWIAAFNSLIFLLFCFLGIWASGQAAVLLGKKDPQKVVVDEVIGQLIVFLFVPFAISWQLILAGFILFRVFDIWKPYPINSLENLPSGLGVCADDILAGVYGGVCLAILYALNLSL